MGRGRQGRRGEKELEDVQRIKHENKKLKRENAALRKQLARIDYTRFQNLAQLVEKQRREDADLKNEKKAEELKKKWRCFECGKGYLYIKIFDHPVRGTMYWRACNLCQHKTKMQPYTKETDGLEDPKSSSTSKERNSES